MTWRGGRGSVRARGWLKGAWPGRASHSQSPAGPDLAAVSRVIAAGAVDTADLLALPAALRGMVLEAVAFHAGLLAVHRLLLADAARREREAQALVSGAPIDNGAPAVPRAEAA